MGEMSGNVRAGDHRSFVFHSFQSHGRCSVDRVLARIDTGLGKRTEHTGSTFSDGYSILPFHNYPRVSNYFCNRSKREILENL